MKEQIEEMIEFLNNRINIERNSYFGKGCITIPIIEADKILDIIKGYRKQSEWISVKKELPEDFENVLLYVNHGGYEGVCIGYYYEGWSEAGVTHWMPLPEAPKMKGGAE